MVIGHPGRSDGPAKSIAAHGKEVVCMKVGMCGGSVAHAS